MPIKLWNKFSAHKRGLEAALSLNRGTLGTNLMYFETGQGAALSSNAHHGVDAQTMEARAYAVAKRNLSPLSKQRHRFYWP